jgi:hypothetical protein
MTHMEMMEEVLRAAWVESVEDGAPEREAHLTYDELSERIAARYDNTVVSAGRLARLAGNSNRVSKKDAWYYHNTRVHVHYRPTEEERAAVHGRSRKEAEARYEGLAEELLALLKRRGFASSKVETSDYNHRLEISVPLVHAEDFVGALKRGLR